MRRDDIDLDMVKLSIDEWLAIHPESEKFNIETFTVENNYGLEERNYISGYFRSMVKKVDSKRKEIVVDAEKITELVGSEKEEKLKENFFETYDVTYENWMKLPDHGKFEYVKGIMKRVGIYYRLNNAPSNKKEWVSAMYEKKVEKTKLAGYSKLRGGITYLLNNEDLIMVDDCKNLNKLDCARCIGTWTSIQGELTKVQNLVGRKIGLLSNSMVKLLQPGEDNITK
jgi:hypothetical protein